MRRGQMNMVLVGAILSIAFLVIMVVTFDKFTNVAAIDDVSDSYCKNKINALSTQSLGKDADQIKNALMPDWVLLEFSRKCQTREEVIDPNKLTRCPIEVKSMTSNTIQTTENCVIYEILELSRRCWDMNMAGTIDGYNWACFNVMIGESEHIDPNIRLRERLNSIFQCGSEEAAPTCNSIKANALSDAQVISVYNAYLINMEDSTKGILLSCMNENAKHKDQNLTIEGYGGDVNIREPIFTEWYREIVEEYNGNLPKHLIDSKMNYSGDKSNSCYKSDFYFNLDSILTNTTDAISEQEQYQESLIAKFCNSRHDPANCLSQNTTLDITAKLNKGLASHINWDEIKNVMSVAKLPNSDLTYEDYFDSDIELRNNEPIRESAAFQVTYCDGLLPLWSGIIPSYACGADKKILLSNDLDAGGSRLARENIASSCPIFSTVNYILPDNAVTSTMTSICEQVTI